MSADVTRFFEMVYKDQELQGALNSALCLAAPEIVVEMAKAKGCQFSTDDLKQVIGAGEAQPTPDASGKRELTSDEVEGVAGGIGLFNLGGLNLNWGSGGILGTRSPFLNFWTRVFRPGTLAGGYFAKISGPTWVNLMAYRKAGWAAEPARKRSLTELHKALEDEPAGAK